eukprot:m.213401 g.213401  ORF g.213401 m.213401 type:complete len:459 (+) comp19054_c0_seq1:53-1429(+)
MYSLWHHCYGSTSGIWLSMLISLGTCMEFDNSRSISWSVGPPLGMAIGEFGMVSDSAAVYVVGGLNSSMHKQDTVWRLNVSSNLHLHLNVDESERLINEHDRPKGASAEWNLESERLRIPVCNAGVVGPIAIPDHRRVWVRSGRRLLNVQNFLLVFGGTMQNGTFSDQVQMVPVHASGVARNTISEFSAPKSMPTRRCCMAVALAPRAWRTKQVFVAGGFDGSFKLGTVEALDLSTGLWTQLAALNTPRSGFSLVAASWALYAVGGSDQNHTAVSSIEMLGAPKTPTVHPTTRVSNHEGRWVLLKQHLMHARMYACSVAWSADASPTSSFIIAMGGTDCVTRINGKCTSLTSVETIHVTAPMPTLSNNNTLYDLTNTSHPNAIPPTGKPFGPPVAYLHRHANMMHAREPAVPPLLTAVHAMGCTLTSNGHLFVAGGELTSNNFTNITQTVALWQSIPQ